jgi:hypothetical protein
MTTYTIDTENSITAFATKQKAGEGESFSNQQELASLVAEWPAERLVEVWNGIPGLTPVKKFKDQKAAVSKIWKAIQSLDGGGAKEAATTATAASKRAYKGKAAAKQGKKTTSVAKANPARVGKGKPGRAGRIAIATSARDGSKKAEVLGLLQRKGGATLAQIMKATGWQAHSVRGFISGALGKKMGLTVDSVRRENGERVYSIG